MLIQEVLVVLLFVVTFIALMAGFPVAFTLSGAALIVGLVSYLFGAFDVTFLRAMPQRVFGNAMWNELLIAVPLFIFMGVMLERSKVAEELLDSMGRLFGSLRGGLGISVLAVGALLAASTGIVGATVVTMGLISLPTMLKRNYDPKLASGLICASGTLGQIIPPSIVLVILGEQISNAYVDAQRAIGNFSPEPVSVGDLFAGALLPGFLLVGLYLLYQIGVAWLRPKAAPAVPRAELIEGDTDFKRLARIAHALVPPVVLIVAVLGSILGGIASPTEAASVGAVGALLLGALRIDERRGWPIYAAGLCLIGMLLLSSAFDLRVERTRMGAADTAALYAAYVLGAGLVIGTAMAIWRTYKAGVLREVMRSTLKISSLVFTILIGAAMFSLVFRGFGGDDVVHKFLTTLPGGTVMAMLVVMLVMFLLGFFLDFIEITFVVVPIVAPILLQLDIDPIWLGIMIAVNLQTSFLTPPFGFALFYLRGVAPPEVTTGQIYRGVVPFIALQLVGLAIVGLWPPLSTYLPHVLFR